MKRSFVTVKGLVLCAVALTALCAAGFVRAEDEAPAQNMAITLENRDIERFHKQAERMAEKIQGATTLEEAAEKLGLQVNNLTDVTFSTNSAATTEPAFVGAVATAKEKDFIRHDALDSLAAWRQNPEKWSDDHMAC